MARLQRKNGRVKIPQRRFCARRLNRSSAESEAIPTSADSGKQVDTISEQVASNTEKFMVLENIKEKLGEISEKELAQETVS
ncbi:hypothetical protein HUG20_08985 [Salicibibacter cibi]|uniref:Uncharacterized protein n=1 Tax=Salicibibacter cibi TaxID=2743001 RepID=A0A7T6ZAN0_9BACI|nr:hypothetical protein [Salicibibacter cibi]QQK80008.1 hypothetical protein HUG20_08985 [Salicibibacter cibi]